MTEQSIGNFVTEVLNGEHPYYWHSTKPGRKRNSIKVCGEDFEKRITNSYEDTLLLVYHPDKAKNRGLKQKFDQFAETPRAGVQLCRMNGVNESSFFKPPQKLPALVLMKKDGSVVEYPATRELMLKATTQADFDAAMSSFVRA